MGMWRGGQSSERWMGARKENVLGVAFFFVVGKHRP